MRFHDPTRKEFHRTPRIDLLYGLIEVLTLLPAAGLTVFSFTGRLHITPLIGGLLGGCLSMAVAMLGVIFNQRIVINHRGIDYRVGWVRIESKWAEMERIASQWDLFPTEGIVVPKSGSIPLLLSKRFIPLSLFAENWRQSELGGHIKQYAPHLFAPKSSEAPESADV
jgi:hypothetical protein